MIVEAESADVIGKDAGASSAIDSQGDDDERPLAASEFELSEEQVRRDREAGLARTEQARAQLKAQQAVMCRIQTKLTENGEYDAMAPRATASLQVPSKSSRARSPSPQTMDGIGSATQRENAQNMSQSMMHRQNRTDGFQRRRKAVEEEERQKREQILLEIHASDTASASAQKRIAEEQRYKSFKAQQRRSEQQKAMREAEREQEHLWETYYAKQNPWASKSPRSPRPATKTSPTLPLSKTDAHREQRAASAEPSSPCEEDIFRTTMQSHLLYNSTMENWTATVKENERRTEAHRRKVLIGAGLSDREPVEKTKNRRFRATVTNIKLANMFMDRASASLPNLQRPSSTNSPDSPKDGDVVSFSASQRDYLPSINKWESRKEQCSRYFHDQEQLATEKLQATTENLQVHRQRIDAHNKERAEKAQEQSKQWQHRNDACAKKRAEDTVKTDAGLVRRQEEHSRRLMDLQHKEREERMEQSAAKTQLINEVQDKARRNLDENAEKSKHKIESKHSTTEQNYAAMLKDFADKADSPKYMEEARAKLQKKATLDEEFRDKAKQELDVKAFKITKQLDKKKQPGLQRQRTLRREKSGLMSPKAGSTLRHQESFTFDEDVSANDDLVVRGPLDSSVEPMPNNYAQPIPNNYAQPMPHNSASSLPPLANPNVQRPSSVRPPIDEDSAHEGIFLKDLEQKSVKWLHDMRKQKENSLGGGRWKP